MEPYLPHRFRLLLIVISGFALHMTNRGNFNVALVAMVKSNPVTVDNTSTVARCAGVEAYNRTTEVTVLGCVSSKWSTTLIARLMGPTWGPSGADRTQVGPMLAPWTLLSGDVKYLKCIYGVPETETIDYLLKWKCGHFDEIWVDSCYQRASNTKLCWFLCC